jgi:molybdopterin-guanine dinucleotide biosynthesis adapter protein
MAKVIGFVGYSNSGKTTLISKVLVILKERGYRVSVIKHDAHGHYKEEPGADSSLFIGHGADSVVTVSPSGIHIYEKKEDAKLEEIITTLSSMDYILIEGFKSEKHPKIAVFRNEEGRAILEHLKHSPIAIATNMSHADSPLPVLDLNDPRAVADFIQEYDCKL